MQPTVAIVQARYSSRRLRGKVVRPLAGRPMLLHLFERLRLVPKLDLVVLATSSHNDDDCVAALGERAGVTVFRGPLDDVLGRFVGAAEATQAQSVVRVSGDSPLLHPQVLAQALTVMEEGAADIVTNVFPRSFPKGQSVEVLRIETLRRIAAEATTSEDREHVTRYAYRHPQTFRIVNFTFDPPHPELQLSVDTEADFQRVERLVVELGAGAVSCSLAEIVDHAERNP